MKAATVTAIATLIFTICGVLISSGMWFGKFVGTTNTSLKYVEEKVTVVASDVKDIKSILISGNIKKDGSELAKGK